MISDIKAIFSMLFDLYKSSMEKEHDKFNNNITCIFDKIKQIEKNYIDVLSKVRYGVIFDNWSGEKIVKYLSSVEYELKSERIYIREELKHINKIYNGELENFVGAVFNIMYCEHIDRFHHGKEIEHRFTGLIEDARRFQCDIFYKRRFLEDIDYMLYQVSSSWNVVCYEYFRLKEKYNNEI